MASTVYDEANYRSLLDMPKVLRGAGISQWTVACGLQVENGAVLHVLDTPTLRDWFAHLRDAAEAEGLNFHVSDEFGLFQAEDRKRVKARHVFNVDFLYRLDPTGGIRTGLDILEPWDESKVRHWNPRTDDAVEASGYREASAPFENSATA